MAGKKRKMSLTVTGTLHKIMPMEQITDTFKKRTFVLSMEDGPYVEYVPFELVQDRTDLIESYKEGDTLTVSFNLKGREWQGKFFCNNRAWRLEKATGDTQTKQEEPPKNDGVDNGSELPF